MSIFRVFVSKPIQYDGVYGNEERQDQLLHKEVILAGIPQRGFCVGLTQLIKGRVHDMHYDRIEISIWAIVSEQDFNTLAEDLEWEKVRPSETPFR